MIRTILARYSGARRGRVTRSGARGARSGARGARWVSGGGGRPAFQRRSLWRPRGEAVGRWLARATGQSLVEYAVILLLIAVAVVGTVTLFGDTLSSTYGRVTSSFIVINSR